MNQFMLFHFTINKNDKIYQFIVQPGAPWDDIEAVLAEFKEQFACLKADAQKQKDEKCAQQESAEVEAQVVQ